MRFARRVRIGVLSGLILLLMTGLFPATQPTATQAASLKLREFYTISKADYDKWIPGKTALPSPKKAFASGTKNVGYLLSYAGATPKVSTYQIILHNPDGSSAHGSVHKFSYKNGESGNYFYYTPRYPDGVYKMTVLLNGKVAGSTSFFVGS
jgi:hypothetical protein